MTAQRNRSKYHLQHHGGPALQIICTLLVLVIFSSVHVFANDREMSKGRKVKTNAVLAGGGIGEENSAIFEEIVRKAGGSAGNIGVVVVSSYPWNWDLEDCIADGLEGQDAIDCADDYGWRYGNSKINIEYYGQILESYGIGQFTGIYLDPTIREENSNPELVDAVNSCTAFFFTGGDQSRGIYALRDDNGKASPVLKAIQKKLKKGALMAGTSAGTAIQTKRYVIANGYNPTALTNGAGPAVWDIAESDLVYEGGVCGGSCDELLYNRFKGVGNFKYGITDTHFSDRERALRLLRLLSDTGKNFGFGIDSDTSLSVENGVMRVIGQDGVTILDLRRARVDRNAEFFNIRNVRISYIREGDSYNANRKRFRLTGSPVVESGDTQIINEDIMDELDGGGFQMVTLLTDLAGSTQKSARGFSSSESPRYLVTLTKDRKTRSAVQDDRVSVTNVLLSVETL